MGQDPSDIRAEIEETRARVGDEVDALSYKTDVPARVGDYVDDKKQAVKDKLTGAKDAVTGTASKAVPSGRAGRPRQGHRGAKPARPRRRRRGLGFRRRPAPPIDPDRERADGRDVGPRRRRRQGHRRRCRRARQAGRPGRRADRDGERPRTGTGTRLEPAGTGSRDNVPDAVSFLEAKKKDWAGWGDHPAHQPEPDRLCR